MPVENLNVAMFHGSDIHITKVERVEVEFKAKSKNMPDKVENFADLVRWQLQKVDPHIGAVA